MNRFLTAENLLDSFPMADDSHKVYLASVVAQELIKMYEDNKILAIYSRIDELEEPLLDILAYDFKVDWYDKEFSLEEKREIFKNCWKVRRKLGLPATVELSLSSLYQSAEVKEWFEYGGEPFYYKIDIDTGDVFTDSDKLEKAVAKAILYKNKRSVLDGIKVKTSKKTGVYTGMALREAKKTTITLPMFDTDAVTWLGDEMGNVLTDENGAILLV